jgi:hypothetical protein
MKNLTGLFVSVLAVAIIASQPAVNAQAFKNGDMVGNLGAGIGWYSYGYGVTSLPAFTFSAEKGVTEIKNVGPLTIGGIVGFKHASYNGGTAYPWKWNDYILAVRGAIHYDLFKNDKVDTYGGIALGVRDQSEVSYTPILHIKENTKSRNALIALYIGGRYYISDKLAVFGELGYGLGYLTLGLSYKFN